MRQRAASPPGKYLPGQIQSIRAIKSCFTYALCKPGMPLAPDAVANIGFDNDVLEMHDSR
jgi:hypothetical protein